MSLSTIKGMDGYLKTHGKTLGLKAIHSLQPLHVPGKDELPDFDDLLRMPFPAQQHVIAAAVKMLDAEGNGFLCGEMGCGKSLLGLVTAHKHACRPRADGGRDGKYRAIVLCPDHLISKWVREIKETIPEAEVFRFDKWKDVVKLVEKGRQVPKEIKGEGGSTVTQLVGRWNVPQGAEWYIIGRNQAKWMPDWQAIGEMHKCFGNAGRGLEITRKVIQSGTSPDGSPLTGVQAVVDTPVAEVKDGRSTKTIKVDDEILTDDQGRPQYRPDGRPVRRAITAKVVCCPRCGAVQRNKRGVPLSVKDLGKKQSTCEGLMMRELGPEQQAPGGHSGLDLRCPVPARFSDARLGRIIEVNKTRYLIEECGEPLWNWTSKPYRWAPARFVQKKLRKMFQYLLIDEVHEQKSDESAQSMAAGKLMASVNHSLALTGTIIGGYANHLFPLMVRMTPDTLRAEGFEWGKDMAFSEAYGRIDRIITTTSEGGAGSWVGRNQNSMRKSRNSTERKAVRPGVMPGLFSRHMIGTSLFITLEQMADELPDLDEFIGEYPADPDGQWEAGTTACEMDDEVKDEYKRVEHILTSACKELLKKGSMKLLGTMLFTLLDYPDMPFGWNPEWEGEHSVGYYNKPNDRTRENWMGVVTPASLDPEVVRPKERKLIAICKAEKAAGRQVWVYCQMTGVRNVQPRLQKLMEAEGLRVAVLRSDTVNPKEREDWIAKNGTSFDVVISHPKLVSTGLDLFSKEKGGHNYATLVFYQTGYNLFDMRQAARRAWRIGQPLGCKVYYLYYKDCMQHRAVQLMSRKMVAAAALEGEFSSEGLVAMAGDDNAQMALARSLSEQIDESDIGRNWGKVKSGPKKKAKPKADDTPKPGLAHPPLGLFDGRIPAPPAPSELDELPMEQQLAAETILADQDEHPEVFSEPEPDDLDGEQDEADTGLARPEDLPADDEDDELPEPPEPVRAKPKVRVHRPEPEPDDEDDDLDELPVMTRASMAKMFANLLSHGLSPKDLDDLDNLDDFDDEAEIDSLAGPILTVPTLPGEGASAPEPTPSNPPVDPTPAHPVAASSPAVATPSAADPDAGPATAAPAVPEAPAAPASSDAAQAAAVAPQS